MHYGAKILVIIILVALGGLFLWGVSVRAADGAALPAGSAAVSVETTATPPPASAKAVRHALKQRAAAKRALRQYKRAAACFLRHPHLRLAARPLRQSSEVVWTNAGKRWAQHARLWRGKYRHLRHHMTHPGGSSNGVRWLPLAKWIGWPSSTWSMLTMVIMRESSGRERAYNGDIGCSGLLQIWPGHVPASQRSRLFDATYNLTVGLKLWRSQGWGPWAQTAY